MLGRRKGTFGSVVSYPSFVAKEAEGKRIRRARVERGLSVAELSKLSGVERTTIYRLEENPKLKPQAATVRKLTQALAKVPKLPEI